jgi:hypothetical protein
MIKRLALLAAGVFVGVVIGIACTYALMHRVAHSWIELQTEHHGLAWANEVFSTSDIPLAAKGIHHVDVETPGAHTWMVWRRNLADLAPLLFR